MIDGRVDLQLILSELRRHSVPVEVRARSAAEFIRDLVSLEGSRVQGGKFLTIELTDSLCAMKHAEKNGVLPGVHSEMLSLDQYRGIYLALFPKNVQPVDLYGTIDGVIGVMPEKERRVKPKIGFSIDPYSLKLRGLIIQTDAKVWYTTSKNTGIDSLNGGHEHLIKTVNEVCTHLGIAS